MEWTKSVVEPIKHVARYSALRGFTDDFAGMMTDIVLLEGEVHLGRKPGFVRYTTVAARDDFARTVLYDLSPSQRVKDLAKRIVKRVDKLNHGRLWLAGHMRRGDCECLAAWSRRSVANGWIVVNVGWAMEGSLRGTCPVIELGYMLTFLRASWEDPASAFIRPSDPGTDSVHGTHAI